MNGRMFGDESVKEGEPYWGGVGGFWECICVFGVERVTNKTRLKVSITQISFVNFYTSNTHGQTPKTIRPKSPSEVHTGGSTSVSTGPGHQELVNRWILVGKLTKEG